MVKYEEWISNMITGKKITSSTTPKNHLTKSNNDITQLYHDANKTDPIINEKKLNKLKDNTSKIMINPEKPDRKNADFLSKIYLAQKEIDKKNVLQKIYKYDEGKKSSNKNYKTLINNIEAEVSAEDQNEILDDKLDIILNKKLDIIGDDDELDDQAQQKLAKQVEIANSRQAQFDKARNDIFKSINDYDNEKQKDNDMYVRYDSKPNYGNNANDSDDEKDNEHLQSQIDINTLRSQNNYA
jgi:hypothetical protein